MCYAMYKWLVKHDKPLEGFKIHQYYANHESDYALQNQCFAHNGLVRAVTHFMWEYDEQVRDLTHVLWERQNDWYFYNLGHQELPLADKIEQFCVTGLNRSSWNSTFNRKKEIPKLEGLLGITLKEIAC